MTEQRSTTEKTQRRSRTGALFGLAIVAGSALYVVWHYSADNSRILAMRSAQAKVAELGPRVETVKATTGPRFRTIQLLGDVRSAASVTLYAKVSGYLKAIHVDKGDQVMAGQILAELESPELEQQFAASSADLVHKKRNLERLRGLFDRGSTTQVLMLQAETDALVAESNVAALSTTKAYQVIRAPFDGRVTARFVDAGALVTNAQTNLVSAMPVVTVSNNARVRVYAFLQQQDVPFIKVGQKAEVSDASRPERRKTAQVTRMTGELDPKSRTMLIEVHLDNGDDFFTPGSFVNLTLQAPLESHVQIPAAALLVRQSKTFVASVDRDRVRFSAVTVGGTDGAQVVVTQGVREGDTLAVNLPDEVTDGARIQPVPLRR